MNATLPHLDPVEPVEHLDLEEEEPEEEDDKTGYSAAFKPGTAASRPGKPELCITLGDQTLSFTPEESGSEVVYSEITRRVKGGRHCHGASCTSLVLKGKISKG